MGDAGHELADAQHFFLLADLGMGPIHVAADRGGEIDGDPQRAGEGHEDAQQASRADGGAGGIGGKVQRKGGNPARYSSSITPPTIAVAMAAKKYGARPRRYMPAIIMWKTK